MQDINIKRFVDINIQSNIVASIASTRDTVVLLTSEGTLKNDKTFSSLSEFTSAYPLPNPNANPPVADTMKNTRLYVSMYFNNGGNKLRIIEGVASDKIGDYLSGSNTIKKLDDDYIVIAYCGGTAAIADTYTALKTIAKTRMNDSKIYGINQKIILARTRVTTDTDSITNFGVKYSKIPGAEMTMAAYLSNINVYDLDSIKDYMFTSETITEESSDDDILNNVLTNNENVDMYLANAVRNLGGNLKDGNDLVNQYCLIILHQTLTARLLNLLTTKISGTSGINQIYTTMCNELNRYVNSGYLSLDKVWTKGNKSITYNGASYTIINNNTPLVSGYWVKILPLYSLSQEDQSLKKCPPIYVILATQYGIRSITIDGEVI